MLHTTIVTLFLAIPAGDFMPFEGDKFTVQMPGKPEKSTHKIPGGADLHRYQVKTDKGVFVITTSEVPEAAKETDDKLQKRLDDAREQGVQNVKGKLHQKESKDLKLASKYPGREIEVELPNKELLRSRFYIVDGRLYQLIVTGNSEFVKGPTADKFLDSLSTK
jgi:hypothetical protein